MSFFLLAVLSHHTVVTAYGFNQLGLDNSMWPLFVTEMHTNPGRLNCANCETQTTEPPLTNHAIRKTLHGCDKFILIVLWINRLWVIGMRTILNVLSLNERHFHLEPLIL